MNRLCFTVVAFSTITFGATHAHASVIWDGSVEPTAVGYARVYNLNAPPTNGWTINSPTPGLTLLNRASNSTGSGYFYTETNGNLGEISVSDGWFVETRLKVDGHTFSNTFHYNVAMDLFDLGAHLAVSFQTDKVEFNSADTVSTNISSVSLASGYHTFKITRLAGDTSAAPFLVSIDGGTPFSVNKLSGAAPTTENVYFGDLTGSTGISNATWDYVAINSTLAVPEPSSFIMIWMGITVLFGRGVQGRNRNA